MMKLEKIIGILIMLVAMVVSDKVYVFAVYAFAALTHEIGHLAAAKLMKIKVNEIKFDFSGVRICVDENLTPYRSEIILSAMGPFVNIVLASIVFFYSARTVAYNELISETEQFISTGYPDMMGICGFFILSSCIQAAINLLPIKTFDGGRILYCILASFFDEKMAEKILSVTSAFFAFILWTISLYLMLKISSGLGVYVFSVCIFILTLKDTYYFDDPE